MIFIGSDHSGINLKELIISYLNNKKIRVIDISEANTAEDDYPDIALSLSKEVLKNNENLAIGICGTGIGMSIACNKLKGIRAAVCVDEYTAEMARKHNNANIICLGARTAYSKDIEKIYKILDAFLNTQYEGGRHDRRLQKIRTLEEKNDLEGE